MEVCAVAKQILKLRWQQIIFWSCAGIMVFCLLAEAILLYAQDGVTPDPLPWAFTISDWVWSLLAVSYFFYFKKPIVTIAVSWITLLVFSISLERFSGEHSLIWFLYRHSILLLFIAAAHLGVFLRRTATKTQLR
jgi:hypothetical protein